MSLALLVAAWPAATAAGPPAEAYFTAPADGAVVKGSPWVRVTGHTRGAEAAAPAAIDVILVIDTSGSTQNSAGARDGGTGSAGGGLTILRAELEAARAFLAASDPATTRVGVVRFAGAFEALTGMGTSGSVNAWVEQPLTTDYATVRKGHAEPDRPAGIARRHRHGGRAAARDPRTALAPRGPQSSPRRGAQGRAPAHGRLPDAAVRLGLGDGAWRRGRHPGGGAVAAKGGSACTASALGPEALSAPMACREAARLTGGTYSPVERPADIVSVLPRTPVGRVELVAVRNATTGRLARSVTVGPEGGLQRRRRAGHGRQPARGRAPWPGSPGQRRDRCPLRRPGRRHRGEQAARADARAPDRAAGAPGRPAEVRTGPWNRH